MIEAGALEPKRFGKAVLLSIVLTCWGAVLHIAQIEYSNWLILAGLLSLGLFYALRFHAKSDKRRLDIARLLLIMSFVFSRIFALWHLVGATFFKLLFAIALLGLLITEQVYTQHPLRRSNDNSLYKRALIFVRLSLILWALGLLFKIQHWPYANFLLIAGLICFTTWAAVNAFGKGEI